MLFAALGSARRALTDWQTDGRTDRRYQIHYVLIRFVFDNNNLLNYSNEFLLECSHLHVHVQFMFCLLFLVKSRHTDSNEYEPTIQFAQVGEKCTFKILDTRLAANLKWPRSLFYLIDQTHKISR